MPRPKVTLDVQLAQHLFGWTWRDDWRAWCPPTWPARDATCTTTRWEYLRALGQAGGQPWGDAGGINARGRPVVPHYRSAPEHTMIIWDWLRTRRTTVTVGLHRGGDRVSGGGTPPHRPGHRRQPRRSRVCRRPGLCHGAQHPHPGGTLMSLSPDLYDPNVSPGCCRKIALREFWGL